MTNEIDTRYDNEIFFVIEAEAGLSFRPLMPVEVQQVMEARLGSGRARSPKVCEVASSKTTRSKRRTKSRAM